MRGLVALIRVKLRSFVRMSKLFQISKVKTVSMPQVRRWRGRVVSVVGADIPSRVEDVGSFWVVMGCDGSCGG